VSYPVRAFKADQLEEALSYAEEGGIAVQPVAVGYMVLGRRRLLVSWAIERGFHHEHLQLPTVTGVWHITLVGNAARQLERELFAPATD
jgi:hypothetical protein